MTVYQLPYDTQELEIAIPDRFFTDFILPAHIPSPTNPDAILTDALNQPINFEWSDCSRVQSVAIAINDKTRPVPHDVILPVLLKKLHEMGIQAENICFWIATGTHLPITPEEYSKILPLDLAQKYEIRSHNIQDESSLVFLGRTSRETNVWVARDYYEADLKIVVGNIEPHHFAGFSGGMKTAAIGLAGRATINHNHAMLSHPDAWIGLYENNPLRQDIEEIGQRMGVHLAVNVILNQNRDIVSAYCGQPRDVMEAGIPQAQNICAIQANSDYDFVIASAGGKPKDINFYQAQKALTHASSFARPGAPILLVAACPEGSGNAAYENLMSQLHSVDEIFEYFRTQPFKVGPHKALQVARILRRNPVTFVSSIPDDLVKRLLMSPGGPLQTAVDNILFGLEPHSRIAILPHATTTLRI